MSIIKKIYQPRLELATSLATEILNEFSCKAPPTPVLEILRTHTKIYYFSPKQNPIFANESGFTIYDEQNGHRTYLNKSCKSVQTPWAHAHELGHIRLEHFTRYIKEDTSDFELKVLDKEASIFGMNLLMPSSWLLKELENKAITFKDIIELQTLFNVNWHLFTRRLYDLSLLKKEQLKMFSSIYYNKESNEQHNTVVITG